MSRPRQRLFVLGALAALVTMGAATLSLFFWLPVANDPLVRMPGTQPGEVNLESPDRCLNCHDNYGEPDAEPGSNWRGTMMAQAARDFIFWSAMTVAAQDSMWALDRPNATDLCLRCHFPEGWLEGRSDPTNASLMTGSDYDGVQCDLCHRMTDPMFHDTYEGTREGDDWLVYWDETNQSGDPSQPAADATYAEDLFQAGGVRLFNGGQFFVGPEPFSPFYTENGGGQYFVSGDNQKRASFADANGRHSMLYSRYHKSKYFCSTCHDVSNPALANIDFEGTIPGDGVTVLPSEELPAHSYFHLERTFSEFMLSSYGLQGGAPGTGPYAPDVFTTSLPNNYIARCQDCHLRDVEGHAADKKDSIYRPSESTEHPESGVPNHNMTGGNAFVTHVLASVVPGSPNYDPVNKALLDQGAGALTLDLTQGLALDPNALLRSAALAKENLRDAASIEALQHDAGTGEVTFRVQNHTAHKLISGFPEGRRMFVNVRALVAGEVVYEINPYDSDAATLKGLPDSPNSPPLDENEEYQGELVYEVHLTSALSGEEKTHHSVLATGRYKDNRIPPRGFRIDEAAARLCEPVENGDPAPGYFTAAEYAGGYDEATVNLPVVAEEVEVRLYYQTTSREYVEFLRDEINGTATTLPADAYIIQTDPWFDQLRAWGDTLWQLWDHNKDVPGAAPVLMTQASTEPKERNTVLVLESGRIIGGKFVSDTGFTRGEEIALRARVVEVGDGDPVRGAVVELDREAMPRGLRGVFADGELRPLRTGPSGRRGAAIALWRTRAPAGLFPGTPPGRYTMTVLSVSDDETVWDGVPTTVAFSLD